MCSLILTLVAEDIRLQSGTASECKRCECKFLPSMKIYGLSFGACVCSSITPQTHKENAPNQLVCSSGVQATRREEPLAGLFPTGNEFRSV